MPRKPSANSLLRNFKKQKKELDTGITKDIAGNLIIPNLSGDHSKGNVRQTPVKDTDIVNKKYVDDNTGLWEVDGTETQLKLADAIDMQNYKIINLKDPDNAQDGATKNYVDTNVYTDSDTNDYLVTEGYIKNWSIGDGGSSANIVSGATVHFFGITGIKTTLSGDDISIEIENLNDFDTDDLSEGTTNKYCTTANVNSAGATMNTDTDVSSNSYVIDEDNMASDLNTKVPTQQSVKAYVDNNIVVSDYTADTDTDVSGKSWVLDEDNMASDSATKLATQQSIKKYVDDNSGGSIIWSGEGKTTASNSASIEFTGLSAGIYKVIFQNIIPASDNVYFIAYISDDSGNTYKTSNYHNAGLAFYDSGSGTGGSYPATQTGRMQISPFANEYYLGTTAGEHGLSGEMTIYNLGSGTYDLHWNVQVSYEDDDGYHMGYTGSGDYEGTGVDAIKFQFSSGNIESGTIHIYKIADGDT